MMTATPWTGLGGRATSPAPTIRAELDFPDDASMTARMRYALSVRGPMSSIDLSRAVGLPSASLVGALLKHDRSTGRVTYCDGLWELDPDWDESQAAQIVQAAALLRRAGWIVEPPRKQP